MAYKKIQFKRGSKAGMPVLRSGEPGFTQDEKSLYIGDGTSNQRFLNETQIGAKIDEKIAPVTQSIASNITTLNQTINTKETAINQSITDKAKINGEATNVNFIRNDVVRDGLVQAKNYNGEKQTIAGKKEFSLTSDVFTIVQEFVINGAAPTNTVCNILCEFSTAQIYITINKNGTFDNSNWVKNKSYSMNTPLNIIGKNYFTFTLNKADGKFSLYVNGVLNSVGEVLDVTKFDLYKPLYSSLTEATYMYSNRELYTLQIYNRRLTPQEIQHNLAVLNNSPSINKINDYAISADTDHVQDRTGRVQETVNRVFYKQNCKEFTSDGSAITVNNGMGGYVLSGKIEGQTVKNEFYSQPTILGSFRFRDGFYELENLHQGFDYLVTQNGLNLGELKSNTTYTLVAEILESNYQETLIFSIGAVNVSVPQTKGLQVVKLTTSTIDKSTTRISLKTRSSDRGDGRYVKMSIGLYEGDFTTNNPIKSPQFGLSSTQAVVYNNQTKYSF